jgi:hypothetical protein
MPLLSFGSNEASIATANTSETFTLKEVRLARKVLAELDSLKKELDEANFWKEVELKNFQEKATEFSSEDNFWNFYLTELRWFSPAEGGCFYYHRTALACYPLSKFESVEQAKAFARDTFGVTFENDITENSDGSTRKVRGLTSCAPKRTLKFFAHASPSSRLQDAPLATNKLKIPLEPQLSPDLGGFLCPHFSLFRLRLFFFYFLTLALRTPMPNTHKSNH